MEQLQSSKQRTENALGLTSGTDRRYSPVPKPDSKVSARTSILREPQLTYEVQPDMRLLRWIIDTDQPTSVVENKEFRELLKDASSVILDSSAVVERRIYLMAKDVIDKEKNRLKVTGYGQRHAKATTQTHINRSFVRWPCQYISGLPEWTTTPPLLLASQPITPQQVVSLVCLFPWFNPYLVGDRKVMTVVERILNFCEVKSDTSAITEAVFKTLEMYELRTKVTQIDRRLSVNALDFICV
ncbi:hypothetical protein AAF712_014656 [Marasmius tenuissimus]|uniref:Uncharacterized protein n=1 Tax=Marasmius tenuissimus TaxID=585030 RepID=A0ABR2ZBN1_9AGAR